MYTWTLHLAILLHMHLHRASLLMKPSILRYAVVCIWLQVSLFSENSSRWLVADQAIMLCGAADAVRGASSPPDELAYIMRQSDSSGKKHFCFFSTLALMHAAVLQSTCASSAHLY